MEGAAEGRRQGTTCGGRAARAGKATRPGRLSYRVSIFKNPCSWVAMVAPVDHATCELPTSRSFPKSCRAYRAPPSSPSAASRTASGAYQRPPATPSPTSRTGAGVSPITPRTLAPGDPMNCIPAVQPAARPSPIPHAPGSSSLPTSSLAGAALELNELVFT